MNIALLYRYLVPCYTVVSVLCYPTSLLHEPSLFHWPCEYLGTHDTRKPDRFRSEFAAGSFRSTFHHYVYYCEGHPRSKALCGRAHEGEKVRTARLLLMLLLLLLLLLLLYSTMLFASSCAVLYATMLLYCRWFSLEEAATVLQRPVHVAMLRGAVTASSSILHQLLVQESFEYLAYECGDALRAMAFPPSLVEVMKGASDTCVGHESYDQSPADSSSSAAPSTTMAPPVAHLGTPYSSLSAHLLSAREHERFVDCDAVDATSAPDSATSTPDHANATARLHNLLLSFVKSMNELNDKTAHTKRADLAQSMSQIIGEAALACRLERFEEPWKALMLNKKDPITMDALSSAYVDRMASISAAASEQEPVSVGLPAS